MKTLVILLSMLFFSFYAEASSVIFRDAGNQSFSVKIEGKTYNSRNGEVQVPFVRPGRHTVEIIRYRSSRGRAPVAVVSRSSITIPAHSVVHARISRNNTVSVARVQEQYRAPQVVVRSQSTNQLRSREVSYTITNQEFNSLVRNMQNARFDSERIHLARFALDSYHFTSHQVSVLSRLFSFENNRLDFVKDAYYKTIDPHNYDLVINSLTFSSSKRSLSQHIQQVQLPRSSSQSRMYYSYRH